MSTTAKELIKAAKRVIANIPTADGRVLADHILSTVKPDDDEPVTRERLEADGWERNTANKHLIQYTKETRGDRFSVDLFSHGAAFWVDREGEMFRIHCLKNMGHLRRLVAALGE